MRAVRHLPAHQPRADRPSADHPPRPRDLTAHHLPVRRLLRSRLLARRVLARHRRLIAVLLAAASTASVVLSVQPPPGVEILAAARDLHGGRLSASDVMIVRLPADAVPDGVFRAGSSVTGRVVAGPVRRGEPLTNVRLLGRGLPTAHGAGMVATPVRIADADVARLLSPGDVVDVLAAFEEQSDHALTVAQDVTIVTKSSGRSTEGALLVLATTTGQAAQLAQAQSRGRLSVTIHSQ